MARIFGIDLGTTNSLIATMEGERARVLADPKTGATILPSVVAIAPDGEVHVGDEAIAVEPRLALKNDGDIHATGFSGGDLGVVIRSVKRYMGLGSSRARARGSGALCLYRSDRTRRAIPGRQALAIRHRRFPRKFCAR